MRSIFITFEGPEGAGKSTLIRLLLSELKKRKLKVISTREPGGTFISEKIRNLLLSCKMGPWTELWLYETARVEHVTKIIRPALNQRTIVLCDRFTDSSLAYQGAGRKLDWNKIKILNHLATQGLKPDLTVFLDVDPKIGLNRSKDQNRFEKENIDFHKKVRKGFLRAMKENPKRWIHVKVKKQSLMDLSLLILKEIEARFSFIKIKSNLT